MRIRTSITIERFYLSIIAALVLLALPASAQAMTTTKEGTASEVKGTNTAWTTPQNASGTTSGQAEARPSVGGTMNALEVRPHLSLPSNATVTGIEAQVSYNCACAMDLTAQAGKGTPVKTHILDLESGVWNSTGIPGLGTPSVAEANSPTFGVTLVLTKNEGPNPIWIRQVKVVVTYSLPPRLWSSNRVPLGEGGVLPVLVWGTPTLEGSGGTWTCETVGIAHVQNVPNGGQGGIAAYETPYCTAPTCEAEGKKGFVAPYGEVNFNVALPESTEPLVQIANISLQAGCVGGVSQIFSGMLFPHMEQGYQVGSGPARLQFAASGELSGGAKVTGNLKLMGFEAGEILGAK